MSKGDVGEVRGLTRAEVDVVVPELDQVVCYRDRIWAVNQTTPSSLLEDAISGARSQHPVRMSSLEDDGLGDELTVIGEIESSTREILQRCRRQILIGSSTPCARVR